MLISKGVTVGEVVTLKLVTSEELVGKLKSESDTHYAVDRPVTLAMSNQGLILQPWLFTVDDGVFNIPKDKVLLIANTSKNTADNYLSSVSGIALG